MTRRVIPLAFTFALMCGSASAQIKLEPAPSGDPETIATSVIHQYARHICPSVVRAVRFGDGSIHATCAGGETFRIATLEAGDPVAIRCSALAAKGIKGC